MKQKLAVIVGRFQCPELTKAHKELFAYASKFDHTLVLIGVHRSAATDRNPLDYEIRRELIAYTDRDATVVPLMDMKLDQKWVENLDALLTNHYSHAYDITFVAGRDSFKDIYEKHAGKYNVEQIEEIPNMSATLIRDAINPLDYDLESFAAGMIHQVNKGFPKAYPTVDVVVENGECILLGNRKNDPKLRFIGGFVDPTDPNLEFAAKREVVEETTLEVGEPRYIGSAKVNDWRYKGTKDGIMTAIFVAEYVFGAPTPSDDMDGLLHWCLVEDLKNTYKSVLVEEHIPIFEKYLASKK